jgi:hypothetical protein
MTQQEDERLTRRSPPSPKSAVAFQIRERLRTFQEDEEVLKMDGNVKQIRKEIQRAYWAFAGTASRTEKEYKMELVLRPLLTSSGSILLQQSILRRTLRTKLELTRDINLGMWSFKAMGGLTKIIEGELRDVVGSIKTKNLYSVEVLLHPCRVGAIMPQNHSRTQVASEQQEGYDNETQRSSIGYKTRVLFTDAGTQTLPDLLQTFKQESPRTTGNNKVVCGFKPVTSDSPLQKKVEVQSLSSDSESPAFTAPSRSTLPLELLDVDKDSGAVQSNPSAPAPAAGLEREDRVVPLAVDLYKLGEQKLKEHTQDTPAPEKETLKAAVKETATCIVACKKERKANDGPDHFLSLLDLARKK